MSFFRPRVLGDVALIVRKMDASGNQHGIVQLWKNMVEHWARRASGPDAEAVKAFLPLWQARALYTAAELAPIFPMLAVALGLRERPEPQKSPARLSHYLRMARMPHREINGQIYFAVERLHFWRMADNSEWEEEISNGAQS